MAKKADGHRTLAGQALCLEIDGFGSGFTYVMWTAVGEITAEI